LNAKAVADLTKQFGTAIAGLNDPRTADLKWPVEAMFTLVAASFHARAGAEWVEPRWLQVIDGMIAIFEVG